VSVHHIFDGDHYKNLRANPKNAVLLHSEVHLHYHNKYLCRNQKACTPGTLWDYVQLLLSKAAEGSLCEFGCLGKLVNPKLLGSFKAILDEAANLV
jgi:hypothetical protein